MWVFKSAKRSLDFAMPATSPAELRALEDVLLNTSNKVGLHDRFRALFALKSLKNDDAVAIISKGVVRFRHYTMHLITT